MGEPGPERAALGRDEAAAFARRRGRTWFLLDEDGTALARLGLIEAGGGGWRETSDERCAD